MIATGSSVGLSALTVIVCIEMVDLGVERLPEIISSPIVKGTEMDSKKSIVAVAVANAVSLVHSGLVELGVFGGIVMKKNKKNKKNV